MAAPEVAAFFGPHGKTLSVRDRADFEAKIRDVDHEVPGRTQGRTSVHRERYCILIWLRTIVRCSKIQFPFAISKCESPDFIIEHPAGSMGLEHTDAGSQEYQRWLTEIEKPPVPQLLPNEDGYVELLPNEDGYVGDQERAWADDIKKAILNKQDKLKSEHFQKVNFYELMIYEVSGFVEDGAVRRLLPKIGDWYRNSQGSQRARYCAIWVVRGFDRVFGVQV